MLGDYLNQTAEYQKKTGSDDRGNFIYSEPMSIIPCRKQTKTVNNFTENRQIVTPQHTYYLEQEVFEGDLLDGMSISVVSEWVDIGGEVVGYKAVM